MEETHFPVQAKQTLSTAHLTFAWRQLKAFLVLELLVHFPGAKVASN